jgi:hypothetical protein
VKKAGFEGECTYAHSPSNPAIYHENPREIKIIEEKKR